MMPRIVVSNSMLRTLCTCSTKVWLYTNGFSAAKADENTPARAGQDAHKAFEKWGRGAHVHDCVQAFLDSYQPYSDKYLVSKDRYYHENLARILEVFFSANPLATLPYEILDTEKQIELSLGTFDGVEFVVSDKSDGLARMKDTGDLFSVEYKTVGYIGSDYINDYELDSQISTHVEALRRNGQDVKGVILEAVQFNKLPDPNAQTAIKKKGEIVGYRSSTCKEPGHGAVANCWQLHVKYGRWIPTRSQEDLQVWISNVLSRLSWYRDVLRMDLGEVPQEGLFGKCGKCEFRPFCAGHRKNLDMLNVRIREEGILYSGLHE